MFSKSRILATLGAFVVLFFGPWLGYSLLMDTLMDHTIRNVSRPESDLLWLYMVIGCLVMAYAFATLYSKWARGIHSFSHGFNFGLWFGIAFFGMQLLWYGTSVFMNLTGHIIDGIHWIVIFGLTGGVISLIFGRFEK